MKKLLFLIPLILLTGAGGTQISENTKFGVDAASTVSATICSNRDTDGTDDDTLNICAGGACGTTRGAGLTLKGDDVGGAGSGGGITYEAGTGTTATHSFATQGSAKWTINADGTLDSTLTDAGFRTASTDNQACTTTCGANKGCLFGLDKATACLVSCSDATADTCICTTT